MNIPVRLSYLPPEQTLPKPGRSSRNVSQIVPVYLIELLDRQGIPHQTLAQPMRWSEDFGHYCRRFPGLFFGIGTGEDAPALHTDAFEFDDTLLPRILGVWLALIGL